jgi:hypothetical protein
MKEIYSSFLQNTLHIIIDCLKGISLSLPRATKYKREEEYCFVANERFWGRGEKSVLWVSV